MGNNKNSILVLALLLISTIAFSQKIYITDYKHQADITIYIAQYKHQADDWVYQVKYPHEATNGKIYITKYPHQADIKIYIVEQYKHICCLFVISEG